MQASHIRCPPREFGHGSAVWTDQNSIGIQGGPRHQDRSPGSRPGQGQPQPVLIDLQAFVIDDTQDEGAGTLRSGVSAPASGLNHGQGPIEVPRPQRCLHHDHGAEAGATPGTRMDGRVQRRYPDYLTTRDPVQGCQGHIHGLLGVLIDALHGDNRLMHLNGTFSLGRIRLRPGRPPAIRVIHIRA